MKKPFAPSCERNQQVILDVLKQQIKPSDVRLLEIGSGTGQHAVFMAAHFEKLIWQTSDLKENHEGIQMWLDDAKLTNIIAPLEYEAGVSEFPKLDIDWVLTANTFHIMAWENVLALIEQLGNGLQKGSGVMVYGPFKYEGQFTSASNADFELWLKNDGKHRGIRDFEEVVQAMQDAGFMLVEDQQMPANNQMLIFKKL